MILKDDEFQEMWEWGRTFINDKCIWRATEEIPKLQSKNEKEWLTWEYHFKNGLLNAEFSSVISQLMLHQIGKEYGSFDFQIAGMESASLPLLTSIPLVAKVYNIEINSFSIKKERNNYGLYNHLEGLIHNKKPVLLIDDVCNSTKTFRNCVNILIGAGCKHILDRPFVMVNNIKIDKDDYEVSCENYLPEQMSVVGIYSTNDFYLPDSFKEPEKEKDQS
jgi:orotate phosphoribosyltransferase